MLDAYIGRRITNIFFLMCREGAKGDEIIEALIANSKTFDKKFQLSQVCLYKPLFSLFLLQNC